MSSKLFELSSLNVSRWMWVHGVDSNIIIHWNCGQWMRTQKHSAHLSTLSYRWMKAFMGWERKRETGQMFYLITFSFAHFLLICVHTYVLCYGVVSKWFAFCDIPVHFQPIITTIICLFIHIHIHIHIYFPVHVLVFTAIFWWIKLKKSGWACTHSRQKK